MFFKLNNLCIAFMMGGFATFMPKVRYYDDVKILKNPLKKRFFKVLNFFIISIVFVFCVVVSGYLSSALTVSGGVSKLVFGESKITNGGKKYYAVMLGEYDNFKEGENVALGSTIQGASGYVWCDEKFGVVGGIYFSFDDAQKVLSNLKESEYQSFIKEIEIENIDITFEYDNKSVRKIEDGVDYIAQLINNIYNYSVSFDKKEINNLAVSTHLSEHRGKCKSFISEFQGLLGTGYNEKLQIIQNALIVIDEILDEGILKTIDNNATGYSLKNIMARLVRCEYEMCLNLK